MIRQETLKDVEEITKWLKSIAWCNAHDDAWIKETIRRLNKLAGKSLVEK